MCVHGHDVSVKDGKFMSMYTNPIDYDYLTNSRDPMVNLAKTANKVSKELPSRHGKIFLESQLMNLNLMFSLLLVCH